jgi:hypothetical protein
MLGSLYNMKLYENTICLSNCSEGLLQNGLWYCFADAILNTGFPVTRTRLKSQFPKLIPSTDRLESLIHKNIIIEIVTTAV